MLSIGKSPLTPQIKERGNGILWKSTDSDSLVQLYRVSFYEFFEQRQNYREEIIKLAIPSEATFIQRDKNGMKFNVALDTHYGESVYANLFDRGVKPVKVYCNLCATLLAYGFSTKQKEICNACAQKIFVNPEVSLYERVACLLQYNKYYKNSLEDAFAFAELMFDYHTKWRYQSRRDQSGLANLKVTKNFHHFV